MKRPNSRAKDKRKQNRKPARSSNSVAVQKPKPEVVEGEITRDELAKIVTKTISMSFTGPIPDPVSMAHYESTLPGLANRIMTLTEETGAHNRNIEKTQSEHRQEMERKLIDGGERRRNLGQILAVIFAMIVVVSGLVIALKGWPQYGSPIIAAAIGSSLLMKHLGGRKNKEDGDASP